jgi:hypothetical protein
MSDHGARVVVSGRGSDLGDGRASKIACYHCAAGKQLGRSCHQRLEEPLHLRADRPASCRRVVLRPPEVDGDEALPVVVNNKPAGVAGLGCVQPLRDGQRLPAWAIIAMW